MAQGSKAHKTASSTSKAKAGPSQPKNGTRSMPPRKAKDKANKLRRHSSSHYSLAAPSVSSSEGSDFEEYVGTAQRLINEHVPVSGLIPGHKKVFPLRSLLLSLIEYAPSNASRRHMVKSIIDGGKDGNGPTKGLIDFAGYWIGTVFLPLLANGRKTPAPSSHPSREGSQVLDSIDHLIEKASRSGSHAALREALLVRHDRKDPLSDTYDKSILMDRVRLTDALKATIMADVFKRIVTMQACHVIPFSINDHKGTSVGHKMSATVWAGIRYFFPDAQLPKALSGDLINTPQNAILLTANDHNAFGAFELAFEEEAVL